MQLTFNCFSSADKLSATLVSLIVTIFIACSNSTTEIQTYFSSDLSNIEFMNDLFNQLVFECFTLYYEKGRPNSWLELTHFILQLSVLFST